jgi:ERCC4-related helicase
MKLMNSLLDDKDKKIMIFSEYENTFTIVKNLLTTNKINYEQIKGTGYHITNIIDKFKKGELQVLLLNASFFGAGLNLEMTTDLIFYHRMKKDLEIQVIGRAQRLGRIMPLNIWKLNYPNESI